MMKRLFAIGLSLLMLVSSYAYSNLLDEFIKMEKVAYKGQTFPQIAVYFAKSGHKNSAILYLDADKHLRIVVEAFLNGKWQKPKCGKIKDGLFVNHIGRPVDIISEPHRDLSIFCFWQGEYGIEQNFWLMGRSGNKMKLMGAPYEAWIHGALQFIDPTQFAEYLKTEKLERTYYKKGYGTDTFWKSSPIWCVYWSTGPKWEPFLKETSREMCASFPLTFFVGKVFLEKQKAEKLLREILASRPKPQSPSEKQPKAVPEPQPKIEPAATTKPRLAGTGTGFVVNKDYVVTAEHVLEDCTAISIRHSQKEINAKTVARDAANDLGLIRLSQPIWNTAKLRGGRPVRKGERVSNYGYPLFGQLADSATITQGNINNLSGLGNDSRFFQFDAPSQPGNSGGPVLDSSGNVVGVVSHILSKKYADKSGHIAQNVNFAVKSYLVESFLSSNIVSFEKAESTEKLELPDIAEKAERFTVLVGCWE